MKNFKKKKKNYIEKTKKTCSKQKHSNIKNQVKCAMGVLNKSKFKKLVDKKKQCVKKKCRGKQSKFQKKLKNSLNRRTRQNKQSKKKQRNKK